MEDDMEIESQEESEEEEFFWSWDKLTRLVNENNINEKWAMGEAFLTLVTCRGNADMMRWLLKKGADPNFRDDVGMTPLMHAVDSKDLECVKVILEAGGSIDSFDDNGDYALHYAVLDGNLEILRTIIAANPRNVFEKNFAGQTPLCKFIKYGLGHLNPLVECCLLLLRAGSDVNAVDHNFRTPVDYLFMSYGHNDNFGSFARDRRNSKLTEVGKLLLGCGSVLSDDKTIHQGDLKEFGIPQWALPKEFSIPQWALEFIENQKELRLVAKSMLELRKRNSKIIGYNGRDVLGIIARQIWDYRFEF